MEISLENQNISFQNAPSPAVSLVYFLNLHVGFVNNDNNGALAFSSQLFPFLTSVLWEMQGKGSTSA